jgi:hypothetical protein
VQREGNDVLYRDIDIREMKSILRVVEKEQQPEIPPGGMMSRWKAFYITVVVGIISPSLSIQDQIRAW